MLTTTQQSAIDWAMDNGFIIKREQTKHTKAFKYNTFVRPVTHLDFFNLLHNSGINLTSHELIKYMCHIKASDYVNNWHGETKLEISSNSAQITISGAPWLNIYLDRGKLLQMFPAFNDSNLYYSDFGTLRHSDNYYK